MDAEAVERYRNILQEERATLRAQLQDYGADPDDPSSTGIDFEGGFADTAQATAERGRVLALVEGLRANLADVEHALARIEAGTYGTCERCGRPIEPERLEALPTASLCIEHARSAAR